MAGKSVPNEIKAKRGTLRPDRVANRELKIDLAQGELPPPPIGLRQVGSEFWSQVLTEASGWISYRLDTHLLRIVCEQLDEREQLRQLVLEQPVKPRLRSGLRELEKAITSNLSTLGLSPTERARLGFIQVKSESKLEELMRRKRELLDRSDQGTHN